MLATEQVAFLEILTFVAGALLVVGGGSLLSTLLRSQRTNEEKLTTYESGEEPVGNAWSKFNTRFYGMAVIFVLFEVETLLLFPCITVWAKPELNRTTGGWWASYTAMSALLFIFLLAMGLAYAWKEGHLGSLQPKLPTASFTSPVPKAHYDQVNRRYAPTCKKAKANVNTAVINT